MSALVWLRDDLRLGDNPALHAAAAAGELVCLYVREPNARRTQGAAGWWLSRSLKALKADLDAVGVPLIIREGAASAIVPEVAAEVGAQTLHWNRRYGPERALDATLKEQLPFALSHQANLLHEPWRLTTQSGGPYKVFTPFWRALQALGEPRAPLPVPAMTGWKGAVETLGVDDLRLEPTRPNWAAGFFDHWAPGEAGAREALAVFLDHALPGYAEGRDRPALAATSRLSPHLRSGEISPFQIVHVLRHAAEARGLGGVPAAKFLSELGWREFSWHLLFHHPRLDDEPLNKPFAGFPWRDDPAAFTAWTRGQTGYPLVDAGMRQLWQTGWMHNRVRMVAASFLIKHLGLDWRAGEAWFYDTLVDADPASNAASWQWVAGCGADAAPFYRIFNPVLQGERFDPQGDYVRRHVPELARLPARYIHAPWTAPEAVLREAGVRLGADYPQPIVDHAAARARALAAYQSIRA